MDVNGTAAGVVALALRVVLGAWFAISGIVKITAKGLDQFTRDVANYRLLDPPWDAAAAYTLPWLEIIAGTCLMIGILRRGALLTIAAMVAIFAGAIGWAWSQGLDISCGCRVGDAPMNYWAKAAELTGYALVIAMLWWMETRGADTAACDSR